MGDAPAAKFELRFELLYKPDIAGGAGYRCETYPLWLQIYMSHELRPAQPLTYNFQAPSASGDSHTHLVSLPMQTPATETDVYAPLRDAGGYQFASVGRQFAARRASRSSSLIFNAYATTMTEDGNTVTARVGTARVPMSRLLEMLRAPERTHTFEIVQNTANPEEDERTGGRRGPRKDTLLQKGTVSLRNVRLFTESGQQLSAGDFERGVLLAAQQGIDNETDAQRSAVAEAMRDMVISSLKAFTNRHGPALLPSPTKSFLAHFHVPEWRMSFLFSPAFAYLTYRSHRTSDRSFYIEALRQSLRRCRMSAERALEYGNSLLSAGAVGQREHAFTRLIVMLITIYANAMPYLDDFVNENDSRAPYSETRITITEDFKSARITNADDCEGTADEPLLEACELVERIEQRQDTPLDSVLALITRVLHCYVPCLTLNAVTNKKAVAAALIDTNDDDVPAHTICVLIPFKQFERWVAADIRSTRLRSTRFYNARASAIEEAPDNLPLLIVDGTARSDPTMMPLSEYFSATERASGVYSRALAHLHDKCLFVDRARIEVRGTRLTVELFGTEAETTKRHRENVDDVSDFYKYVVKVQTLATVELGVCDFAAVMRKPRTYGVYFNQFLLQTNQMTLVPYLQVTPTQLAQIDMLLAAEEFVPPLANSGAAFASLPDRVSTRLNAIRRSASLVSLNPADESTVLHAREVIVSARISDLGEPELRALEKLAAMPDVKGVDVNEFRIADATGQVGAPMDMVDVTYAY
jgi:hypothetical protein